MSKNNDSMEYMMLLCAITENPLSWYLSLCTMIVCNMHENNLIANSMPLIQV